MNDRFFNVMTPIGLKFRVEYSDQGESFKDYLPRTGSIERQVKIQDWVGDWFVFKLDKPFEYQIKTDKPFNFKIAEINHFLIRSRWLGHSINDSKENSIDILLDPQNCVGSQAQLVSNDFISVCWGSASQIK